MHLEPRYYQINYVNNIIDQRHQYGVFVEGPTSLPRSVLSGEERGETAVLSGEKPLEDDKHLYEMCRN